MQANRFSSVKQRTHGLDGAALVDWSWSGAVEIVGLIIFVSPWLPVVGFDVDSTEDWEDVDSLVNDCDVVISTSVGFDIDRVGCGGCSDARASRKQESRD
jgi:hypothetical protein